MLSFYDGLYTQTPAFAVGTFYELVRFIKIGDAHIGSVPHQLDISAGIGLSATTVFSAGIVATYGKVTHQNALGQGSGNIKM